MALLHLAEHIHPWSLLTNVKCVADTWSWESHLPKLAMEAQRQH